MKNIFLIISFVFTLNLSAQTREDSLKNMISVFFNCINTHDKIKMSEILIPNCEIKSISILGKETNVQSLNRNEFLKAISYETKDKHEEKLLNYTLFEDEILTTIWTEYEFLLNDKLHHSGVNQFTFMRNKENLEYGWQIISIIDSRYDVGKGDLQYSETSHLKTIFIDSLLNDWHKNAAMAKLEPFFDFMSDSCIYKGTDKTERWSKSDFHTFCKPFFDKGKAWDFKPLERNIRLDDNLQTAWFDERLNTWMGECKASGVLKKENGEWKLWLYDLSVTIDNDKIKSFIKLTEK